MTDSGFGMTKILEQLVSNHRIHEGSPKTQLQPQDRVGRETEDDRARQQPCDPDGKGSAYKSGCGWRGSLGQDGLGPPSHRLIPRGNGTTSQARHIFPLREAENPNVSKRPHLPSIDAHATRMGTVFDHTNAMLPRQSHHVVNRTGSSEQMGSDDGAGSRGDHRRDVPWSGIKRLSVHSAKNGSIPEHLSDHGNDGERQRWKDNFGAFV